MRGKNILQIGSIFVAITSPLTLARGDAVTEWNANWEEAVFATSQPIPAQARCGAILHVAIFDAVNGIARKYTPYYVDEAVPPGARQEAAAIQAGYTVLRTLYPGYAETLDTRLEESLSGIPGARGASQSIARGRAWGSYVAEQILLLRSTDGWTTPPTPYWGGLNIGQWRSIEVPALPAAAGQLASLAPFALEEPGQFLPPPPYAPTLAEALASAEYAADLNEVKAIGRIDSTTRTDVQTHLARLWQAVGPIDENRCARSVVPVGNSLVENARMLALFNMAVNDALIASMNSKWEYGLWRPHHAIRFADQDDNPATEADETWTALILAPRFPEYVSNHASLTSAAMHTLARLLGDEHTFQLSSPNYPFISSFERFSDAATEAKEARIWAGIHYRHSCDVGQALGEKVANYVLDNYLQPTKESK